MTGLEPARQVILEIGCVITDSQLKIIAESDSLVIHHSEEVLARMDPWCIEQHGKSGLSDRVRKSLLTTAQAEQMILDFIKPHVEPQSSPLCGNSIGQDRRFLVKYMPTLNNFFHYRNIDVSTVKELVKRWYADSLQPPEKKKNHQVMDDIKESIEELHFYRTKIFRPS